MHLDPIIEPEEIQLGSDALLLDVRAAGDLATGRLRGSVRLPIEVWEAAAKHPETSLEYVAYWERAIGALGMDNSRMALVYDDGRMTEAARVWFILQHFGAAARVVNGGWKALSALHPGAVTRDAPPAHEGRPFTAHLGTGRVRLVRREDLKEQLGTDLQIFDTRTAAEHAGQDLRKNSRGGHLPGAINLPHIELLENARLKSASELAAVIGDRGLRRDLPVVTHCDGGGRAALAAIAALRGGFDHVAAYYLSFSDWAQDGSCRIVRPGEDWRPALPKPCRFLDTWCSVWSVWAARLPMSAEKRTQFDRLRVSGQEPHRVMGTHPRRDTALLLLTRDRPSVPDCSSLGSLDPGRVGDRSAYIRQPWANFDATCRINARKR